MQNAIDWETNDATLEEHGQRGEPVLVTVLFDRVKVKTVKISSEALEDHGVAACKAIAESDIRGAAARGVSPRDMFIEIRTAHPGFRLLKAS
jgi:hypothetical protein